MKRGTIPIVVGLPSPGDVVADKYRVKRLLAVGGMGAVFECEHTFLSQPIALKVLTDTMRPEAIQRFLNEARAAASIESDHVVKVFDFGVRAENGAPYLVMELLVGQDLEALLETRGALSVSETVDCVLEAVEALAQAHALGIIHRDLKPANLFLTTKAGVGPSIKVLDFGISKSIEPAHMAAAAGGPSASARTAGAARSKSLTATNSVLGSPLYISPEQIEGSNRVDARADLWSLGVIMFQLLTGTTPFDGASVPLLFAAIVEQDAPRLRSRRPDAPPELEAIIEKCLQRSPDHRYASAIDLAKALAPFATERGARALQKIHVRASSPSLRSFHEAPSTGRGHPPLHPESASTIPVSQRDRDRDRTGADGWDTPHASPRPTTRASRFPLVLAGVVLASFTVAFAIAVVVARGLIAPSPTITKPAESVSDVSPSAALTPSTAPAASPTTTTSASASASASAAASSGPPRGAVRPRTQTPTPTPTSTPSFDPFVGPRR